MLHATGRDIEETELALRFNAGSWTALDGPASDYALGNTRQRIVRLLRDQGTMTSKQVAEALAINHEAAKKMLQRMLRSNQVDSDGEGLYRPLSLTSLVSPTGDGGDGRDTTHQRDLL